jgi:hypothetical protein
MSADYPDSVVMVFSFFEELRRFTAEVGE